MHWEKLGVAIVGIILLIAAFVVVGNTVDNENTLENRLFDEDLVVEDLEVNDEDEQLILHENETVTVTATVMNEGDDIIDVPLVVEWYEDDELVIEDPHKGTLYEDLDPGQTEDVNWTRDHFGWWPDNYRVRVGDETVNVIVVRDLQLDVEDLEVNGEPDHLEVGMDDSVTVTATVTNEGNETVDVPLMIASWGPDLGLDDPHKGRTHDDLDPDQTEDIEWAWEHEGWWADEYTVIVGTESVTVTVLEDPDVDLVVEEFTVNGETEDVEIELDDIVEIRAEVSNHGDSDVDMMVVVEEDGEEIETGRHSFDETAPAGDEGIIQEDWDHDGWYEGEFTVRLSVADGEIEETITVTLLEDLVDEEVDWDEIRIMVGLIIAAFIIGIGVGVLWTKKR